MAKKMMLKVVILVSLLILQLADSQETVTTPPVESPHPPPKIECDGECNRRCELSSRPNLCKRACGTCCERCNCVPPGTSGHYETCPCYANMTTHRGLRKCP
ncbi:gibberellin-regulated protein 11 [Prunus yedoensis var. nudiflora]|uniref:Gibberellin-regulated protein 11 n=2 Tax=Prunus TaxID=3754 RepID=A0A314ZT60_PRUYE|nr:gibberellin-regulated protein 11-like [Prunus avium]PQQ21553.1 gibberellin-regulated protein 11 [Prunus yedoensis var. nudiflora]